MTRTDPPAASSHRGGLPHTRDWYQGRREARGCMAHARVVDVGEDDARPARNEQLSDGLWRGYSDAPGLDRSFRVRIIVFAGSCAEFRLFDSRLAASQL